MVGLDGGSGLTRSGKRRRSVSQRSAIRRIPTSQPLAGDRAARPAPADLRPPGRGGIQAYRCPPDRLVWYRWRR